MKGASIDVPPRGCRYSPSFSLRDLGSLSGSIFGLFTSGPGSSGLGSTGSEYGSCGSGSRGGRGGSLGSGIQSLLQSSGTARATPRVKAWATEYGDPPLVIHPLFGDFHSSSARVHIRVG